MFPRGACVAGRGRGGEPLGSRRRDLIGSSDDGTRARHRSLVFSVRARAGVTLADCSKRQLQVVSHSHVGSMQVQVPAMRLRLGGKLLRSRGIAAVHGMDAVTGGE